MSEANVEFMRSGFEDWIAGGFDPGAVFGLYAPDVEWDLSAHPLPDFPDRGSGRDELFRHLGEYSPAGKSTRPRRVFVTRSEALEAAR